jgi:hypothetical protein
VYKGETFDGQHEDIVSEELFLRVEARRQRREGRRRVTGPAGVLQGIASCVACGRPLQSDRQERGAAMYRERHAFECATNNRSVMAHFIDDQLGVIFASLALPADWRARIARYAAERGQGQDIAALMEKRRRLIQAYADGGFSEAEYLRRRAQLDAQIREAEPASQPSVEEAAQLLADLPRLWREATNEERRRLIAPLIERVYVDMAVRRIAAITPTPEFRWLLEGALEERQAASPNGGSPQDWSWWRRGRTSVRQTSVARRTRCRRACRATRPNWVKMANRNRLGRALRYWRSSAAAFKSSRRLKVSTCSLSQAALAPKRALGYTPAASSSLSTRCTCSMVPAFPRCHSRSWRPSVSPSLVTTAKCLTQVPSPNSIP